MKIQAVMIDGYKNLSNVRITFDNITALVALNNFGKSNVLSGIDFGLNFIKASIDEKFKMMANANLIPINNSMQGRNYKFEVEVLTEEEGINFRVKYGYEFKWQCDEDDFCEIVQEYLKFKLDEKGKKYTQLINRKETEALYKGSETGRCSSNIKIVPSELVVNKLSAFDELYYANIIKKLNSMKFYMENNLDAKSFYRPDPIIRKGLGNMTIDGDNLPRVIYHLKKEYRAKYDLLLYVYEQLFPNIEEIIVKQYSVESLKTRKMPDDLPFVVAKSIHLLYVKDKNLAQPIDFELMSDGAKRIFLILTKVIVASISNISLIAIEEPENSVHPKLFQSYIQILNQLLDECKIIITSHSPYIISYLDPSCIHVGMYRFPGKAEFFKFKKSGQKLLQQDAAEFDMSMGDYLFSMLADHECNMSDYLECDVDE